MLTGTNGGHRDRQRERASEKREMGGVYRLRQGVGEGDGGSYSQKKALFMDTKTENE